MKILELQLTNYIGIYNGMGLSDIIIDFKLCKYNTVVIKGDNGSGKSTIMSALSPFPDNNTSFIPGLVAKKRIVIANNMDIFEIVCIHGVKNNGDRDVAKAYITKTNSSTQIELNPNGNIGSFKETLEIELGLDSNFLALSRLSGEDKGLVDKTPSERKRFVSSIMSNLDTYNNINKKMTKLSSLYKSMMDTIVSKINLIGDEDSVRKQLMYAEEQVKLYTAERDTCMVEMGAHTTKMEMMDPDGTIQASYENYKKTFKELSTKKLEVLKELNSLSSDSNIDWLKCYNEATNTIFKLNTENEYIVKALDEELNEREVTSKLLLEKSSKLTGMITCNIDDIDKRQEECMETIRAYKSFLDDSILDSDIDISEDVYRMVASTLNDIYESIQTIKANNNYAMLQDAISRLTNNQTYSRFDPNSLSIAREELNNLNLELANAEAMRDLAKEYANRPKTCKVDNCPFIKSAKDANDIVNKIPSLIISRDAVANKVKAFADLEIYENSINDIILSFRPIERVLRNNMEVFAKMNILNTYNLKDVYELFANDSKFKVNIERMYQGISNCSIITAYKNSVEMLNKLIHDKKQYENDMDKYHNLKTELDNLNTKISTLVDKIESNNAKLSANKVTIDKAIEFKDKCDKGINLTKLLEKIDNELAITSNNMKNMKDNINNIYELVSKMSTLESRLEIANRELDTFNTKKQECNHQLSLLSGYRNELASYQDKYNMVDVIKRYSSPNKDGIQKLFMQIYMGKTLSMANELLSLLFNGQFVLQPYIINESEFRIPCLGTGLLNDDISSMSLSQRCMISMILSFVLLHQSSTRYNILKLDEIDAGLDYNSRLAFLNVLTEMMSIMKIEQVFLISHNSELDLNNCDVIWLKSSYGVMAQGNIIFNCN